MTRKTVEFTLLIGTDVHHIVLMGYGRHRLEVVTDYYHNGQKVKPLDWPHHAIRMLTRTGSIYASMPLLQLALKGDKL